MTVQLCIVVLCGALWLWLCSGYVGGVMVAWGCGCVGVVVVMFGAHVVVLVLRVVVW